MISFNPGADARERLVAKIDGYEKTLDAMSLTGTVLSSDSEAWKDPDFHRLITSRLSRLERVAANAKKWDVLKELCHEIGRSARG